LPAAEYITSVSPAIEKGSAGILPAVSGIPAGQLAKAAGLSV